MSKNIPELRDYKNQQLMTDFNEMQIRIKCHLFTVPEDTKRRHPKPTVQELDELLHRVMSVLKQDSKSFRV